MFPKSLEDSPQISKMVVHCFPQDTDIVEKCQNDAPVEAPEDEIHRSAECTGGIAKTERETVKLKQAMACPEGCLFL